MLLPIDSKIERRFDDDNGVSTVDKNIRISYDLLILISKNEYLKIKID